MPALIPTGQKLQPVTITFASPGSQPPVFVAGNFTHPPWTPHLMDAEEGKNSTVVFSSTFHLPVGRYQYKFKLGTGDWWVLDDGKETVQTDGGITNNLMVIEDDSEASMGTADTAGESSDEMPAANQSTTDHGHLTTGANAKPTMHMDVKPTNQQTEALENDLRNRGHDPYVGIGDDVATPMDGPGAPLLPHEMGVPPALPPITTSPVDPPFRKPSASSHKSRSNSIVPQAPMPEDFDDPSLEKFPEGRQNVLKRIQTLKQQLPEDQARDIEAVASSDDDLSEDVMTDANEFLPDPVTANDKGYGISHEQLDSVPEYGDPAILMHEADTELACPGSPQHDHTENRSKWQQQALLRQGVIASNDRSTDEYRSYLSDPDSALQTTGAARNIDAAGQATCSEYVDAMSDTPLLRSEDVGCLTNVWRYICCTLARLWTACAGKLKAKSE